MSLGNNFGVEMVTSFWLSAFAKAVG